jgi:hypothetical protein
VTVSNSNTPTLCFIDTETTGLDPRIHQPYEVCFWREDAEAPTTMWLPHTLEFADAQALRIGGYFDRDQAPWRDDGVAREHLIDMLRGVTLVGANPGFDAAMLRRFIGTEVWHYRFINISDGAMWLFGWDRPRSLLDTAAAVRDAGYDIPNPDHTAEGDVRTTRAVYESLLQIATYLRGEDRSA